MPRLIDSMQTDKSMSPLSSYLFTCDFSASPGSRLFTPSVLKKLNYSVLSLNIPKMKPDSDTKAIQYGSFFVSFPFFSTGEKEMRIQFYETDDMMISKILYAIQAGRRWKARSLYSDDGADLFAEVAIHDQRNTLSYNKFETFRCRYSLFLEHFDPPKFSRTGTVQLLTVEATFNALEGDFGSERWRKSIDRYAGFDAEDEMNRTVEEGGLDQRADAAAISQEEIQNRVKKFEEQTRKILGIEDPAVTTTSNGAKNWLKAEKEWLPKKDNQRIDWDSAYKKEGYEGIQVLKSQIKTKDTELVGLAEKLGRNPMERMENLSDDPRLIKKIRNAMMQNGKNPNDWHTAAETLNQMGILPDYPTGYCQKGTAILNALVRDTKYVRASSADVSREAWRTEGFLVSETKTVKNGEEANKYLGEVATARRVSSGDKAILYYKGEKYGHIVTFIEDPETGKFHTYSDFKQKSMSGVRAKPVERVEILRADSKTEEEKKLTNYREGLK